MRVLVTADQARYTVDASPAAHGDSDELRLVHHGERFTLTAATPIELAVPPIEALTARPTQPIGRAPLSAANR